MNYVNTSDMNRYYNETNRGDSDICTFDWFYLHDPHVSVVQDTVPLVQVHVLQLSPAGKVAPEEKDMPLCTQAEDIEYRNEYRKFSLK